MSLSTTTEAIADQRERGWPDFHPERFCHRCFGLNIWSWSTPHDLWKAAGLDADEIVCPQCFTELYFKATGKLVTWRVIPDTAVAE